MGFDTDLYRGAQCRSACGDGGEKARDLEEISEETKSTVRDSKGFLQKETANKLGPWFRPKGKEQRAEVSKMMQGVITVVRGG